MRKPLLRLLLTAVSAVYASVSADIVASEEITIYGSLLFSGSNELETGIYKLTVGDEVTLVPVEKADGIDAGAGGFYAKGKYYCNSEQEMYGSIYRYHYVYNADTWYREERKSFYNGSDCAYDMAYDPTLGRAFGCFMTDDDKKLAVLGSYNLGTFEVSRIGAPLERPVMGMAISAAGTLYGIDAFGFLYTFDKYTGKTALVGDTKVEAYYTTSAVYDNERDKIYYISQNDDELSTLYSIDPKTAVATKLCNVPDNAQMSGLFIPAPEAADNAPAAASALAVEGMNSPSDFNVRFTAPAVSYSGATLADADLDYTVSINCVAVKTGKIKPGEEFNENITVGQAGMLDLTVLVANENGQSPVAGTCFYAGNDTPAAITGLKTEFDATAMKITLSWEPVAGKGVNNGFVNPSATTYKVVRYPDEKVSVGIIGTEFTDILAEPETGVVQYYYTVSAVFDGKEGSEVRSPVTALGTYDTPYSETFENADAFGMFYVDNIKNPVSINMTWQYVFGCAKGGGDSWLITPNIRFCKGYLHKLTFKVKGEYGYYDETFEVAMGAGVKATDLTKQIIEKTTFRSSSYKDQEADFAVDADGVYNIGIHYCSAFGMAIRVDDIKISAGELLSLPLNPVASVAGGKIVLSWEKPTVTDETRFVITGYNIYRDGVKLNAEPVTDMTYVDETADGMQSEYAVSTVYDKGESLLSGPVKVTTTGIDGVIADGDVPVEYFNLQGVRVANPQGGVYILRQGGKSSKVAM